MVQKLDQYWPIIISYDFLNFLNKTRTHRFGCEHDKLEQKYDIKLCTIQLLKNTYQTRHNKLTNFCKKKKK